MRFVYVREIVDKFERPLTCSALCEWMHAHVCMCKIALHSLFATVYSVSVLPASCSVVCLAAVIGMQ